MTTTNHNDPTPTGSLSDAEPVPVPIPGWERPAWAEEVRLDGGDVTFTREARRIPLVYTGPDASEGTELVPHPVELIRNDELLIGDDGAVRVVFGAVCVYLGTDIEQLPVSEARLLAEALIELADHAEGVASA
jgi:hypothetical protein